MNKILIAVFDSEPAAYEGVAALKDLHTAGDISLYASSVIAKDAAGAVAVRQAADSGPLGTLVGIVGGSLVGLLGGPAGALFGVGVDLMEQVGTSLTPGKVAVVADIDESWTTPVDTRLDAMGATVFRRYPSEVADQQLAREAEAAEAEMRQLDAEFEQADDEARAKALATAAAQREKLEALVARVEASIKQEKAAIKARLATLHAQLDNAREKQRNRIETRINEATAAHLARQEKLEEAREHAKAALELTREAIQA